MGDYLRTTRECTLDNMRPELATAIRTHLEKLSFEAEEISATICFETISTKQNKGFFRSKTEVFVMGILLSPKWLICAAGKENEQPGVLSAKLNMIQVEDYEKSTMYNLVQDSGVNVQNVPTSNGLGTIFIGLGTRTGYSKIQNSATRSNQKSLTSESTGGIHYIREITLAAFR